MIISAAQLLGDVFSDDVAWSGLVPRPAVPMLLRSAQGVSAEPERVWIERGLGDSVETPCLGLRIDQAGPGATWLAEGAAGKDPLSPSWQRLVAFAQQWIRSGTAVAAAVPALELLFADDPRSIAPIPTLVFDPFDGTRQLELLWETVWPTLLGPAGDSRMARRLERCLTALPREGNARELTVDIDRLAGPLLLRIALPAESVTAYLTAIDWPGRLSALIGAVSHYGREKEEVELELWLGASLATSAGIVVTPRLPVIEERDRQWRELLDALLAEGLTSESCRKALLAWPGASPAALRALGDLRVICTEEGPPEARIRLEIVPRHAHG